MINQKQNLDSKFYKFSNQPQGVQILEILFERILYNHDVQAVRKYAVPTGGQAVRIGMPAMYSVTHSRMGLAPDRIYCIYDRVVDGTSSTTSTTQVLT